MPNAGGFQRIGNRFMTHVNPEYMGRLARTFAERGVRLLGGCCEVHPQHIREMRNYLQGHLAGDTSVRVASSAARQPAGEAEKRANGEFSRNAAAPVRPPRPAAPRARDARAGVVLPTHTESQNDWVILTFGIPGRYKGPCAPCAFPPPP